MKFDRLCGNLLGDFRVFFYEEKKNYLRKK